MSTQVLKVFVPRPVAVPRGALWASQLAVALAQGGAAVWRAFEAQGRARAERELRSLVVLYPARPEFALALRTAMQRAAMERDS